MSVFTELQRLPRPAKILIQVFVDACLGGVSFWLAALARTGSFPRMDWYFIVAATLFAMVLVPCVGYVCGLYRSVIRFHTPKLAARVGLVSFVTGLAVAAAGLAGGAKYALAFGLGTVFGLILFALIVWSRHIARLLMGAGTPRLEVPVAIYGAGESGRQLLAILRRGHERVPTVFIDDDKALQGRTIEDLLVIGPHDKKLKARLLARGVKEILLAIPSVPMGRRREILEFLSELPFHVRSVPRFSELVNQASRALADLKDISIEDLLGRETVSPLDGLLEKCVLGKVVLVTGGGGSIGSELCRQVLALRPKHLVVLDHSEFALYQIEQELRGHRVSGDASLPLTFVLGSVTDAAFVDRLMDMWRVDTIYHAAAYKHVPIVEANPVEGLRNNVLGTWYVARAAARTGAGHFVLISSDKAVRPMNVMGATKRMSELVVQMLAAAGSGTIFSMVRFGNVLDSSGSVVPLFRQQIERGGPVTLTHPDVTRYFMTIQEAVQLVIQAGAMAAGGEVFVLDMGEPVKIRDLAIKMIRLSGRAVRGAGGGDDDDEGIAIELVGLRPGEKLFEELLISGDATKTTHPRIWQAREKSADAGDYARVLESIEQALCRSSDCPDVARILTRWVDGYGIRQGD